MSNEDHSPSAAEYIQDDAKIAATAAETAAVAVAVRGEEYEDEKIRDAITHALLWTL